MAATAIASRVESLVGDLGAVRAPRGTERECKGWHQEAALQDALQQPRSRGGRGSRSGSSSTADRAGGTEPRGAEGDRRRAARARGRRDAARPEREAGGRLPHAPRRPARASRQLAPRAPLRHLGRVPPARGRGAHDVRADDGGVVDLHRHAGDPPGHLPDVRGGRRDALGLARPGRPHRPHGRARRDGRRPAAGGVAGGARQPERRGRPAPHRAAPRDALSRRGRRRPGRRASTGCGATPPTGGACRSASSETPPTSSPRSPAAATTSTS